MPTDPPYTGKDIELIATRIHEVYCGGDHGSSFRPTDEDEQAARDILDALAAAGRLLPEGAEAEVIYGARNSKTGQVQVTGPGPAGVVIARASLHPIFVEVVSQERRLYPDGTRLTTPWFPVDADLEPAGPSPSSGQPEGSTDG